MCGLDHACGAVLIQEPAQQAKAKAQAEVAKEQVENAKGPMGLAPESKGTEGEDGPPADGAEGRGGPPASGAEGKDKPATVSAPCAARQHPQILDDTQS